MGAVWSQATPGGDVLTREAPNTYQSEVTNLWKRRKRVPEDCNEIETTRELKRVKGEETENGLTKVEESKVNDEVCGAVDGGNVKKAETQPQSATSRWDTTPDEGVSRFTVFCKPVYWLNRKELVKLLAKVNGLPPYSNVQKISKWDHFFITFPNAVCADSGLEALSRFSYRGVQMTVERSAPRQPEKRMRSDKRPAICLSAAAVTAKWREIAYEEQVKRKTYNLCSALSNITKKFRKELGSPGPLQWLDELISPHTGLRLPKCCDLVRVLSAEDDINARDHYRNKAEFTIGMSPDSCGVEEHTHHVSELAIGYSLGLMRDGQASIGPVDSTCVTTSKLAIHIADVLTPVVATSNMPVYDRHSHMGYWRQVTIREGRRSRDVLVIIAVAPPDHTASDEEQAAWDVSDRRCQDAVVTALVGSIDNKQYDLGVFWQTCENISSVTQDCPIKHLFGIEVLQEKLCGLTFRLQPTAFFQVNTIMAERLYELIGAVAEVDKDTVVLDLCCGTGTIGLSLAGKAHSVIGIESNAFAVDDAVYNASLNKIDNATFITGKVEDHISKAINQVDSRHKCVVILDPPRPGLPNSVMSAVRAIPSLERLVYISCEPKNLWTNALALCRPTSKAYRLEPFRPVQAHGVDLFPHTDHVEMVTVFTRKKHASEE